MNQLNPQIPLLFSYDAANPKIEYSDHPPIGLAAMHLLRDKLNYLTRFPSQINTLNELRSNSPDVRNMNFWYCYFTTDYCFKIHNIVDLMGDTIYNMVLKGEAYVILDLTMEPPLSAIDSIYEDVVLRHNIPASQVIFLSNMYDAEKYSIEAAKSYESELIRIWYFSALEWTVQYALKEGIKPPNTLAIKPYPKKFLNFNRRWRSHRPMFVLLLYYHKLLDLGYVSLAPDGSHPELSPNTVLNKDASATWNYIWAGLKSDAALCPEILKAINSSESIKQLPPLYLDMNDMSVNVPQLTNSPNRFYEDSYFSIVSETTYYHTKKKQNSRFVTEKTFKAIAMQHPFILLTIPYSLDVLRRIGYKTFSPWIDESYDRELNDNKRMLMVLEETRRLCNLNEDELKLFLVECKKICDFNFKLLQEQTNFIYGKL